jgi:hypothetical protein
MCTIVGLPHMHFARDASATQDDGLDKEIRLKLSRDLLPGALISLPATVLQSPLARLATLGKSPLN